MEEGEGSHNFVGNEGKDAGKDNSKDAGNDTGNDAGKDGGNDAGNNDRLDENNELYNHSHIKDCLQRIAQKEKELDGLTKVGFASPSIFNRY